MLKESRLRGGVVDATEETVPEQLIYLFPEITSTRQPLWRRDELPEDLSFPVAPVVEAEPLC